MSNKLREQQELEALQARWVGTGSADTTSDEFLANMQRDTMNSFIGHPPLLQYAAIGLGKTREQTRVALLERMIRPVQPKEDNVNAVRKRQQDRQDERMRQLEREMREEGMEQWEKDLERRERMKNMTVKEKEKFWMLGPAPQKGVADEFGFGPNGERARF